MDPDEKFLQYWGLMALAYDIALPLEDPLDLSLHSGTSYTFLLWATVAYDLVCVSGYARGYCTCGKGTKKRA